MNRSGRPKTSVKDLTIFGGLPAFEAALHVGMPNVGDRDQLVRRLNSILDERRLTNNGPFVREFEELVCSTTRVKHAVAMCNGTIAIMVAMRALGLSGEVILPSFTFIAAANVAKWLDITPVFCDVDLATHNLDPASAASLVTSRTSGIVPVHLWGRPCDVESIDELARAHSLNVLFDAAHAFGCTHNFKHIGNFGDAEIFSFHATKVVNAFEGGVVTTNDDGLADDLRLMRNFGFAGLDDIRTTGINAKMSEVSAAMGITSIENFGRFVAANRVNYQTYADRLLAVPGISLLPYRDNESCNYHYVVVEIDDNRTGISRDDIVRVLRSEGILARRYFAPGNHKIEPFASDDPRADDRLPNTARLARTTMTLPTGECVSREDVDRVCEIIALLVRDPVAVRRALEKVVTRPE